MRTHKPKMEEILSQLSAEIINYMKKSSWISKKDLGTVTVNYTYPKRKVDNAKLQYLWGT